jgi:adenylate cyclase
MSFEIERKFLVHGDAWRNSAIGHTKIRQAYLDSSAKISMRVRIKDDRSATLTLKSRSSKLRRREFEYAIPTSDAAEMISFRRGHIVEKVRYIVPYGNLNWEVDVFSGENLGWLRPKSNCLMRTTRLSCRLGSAQKLPGRIGIITAH